MKRSSPLAVAALVGAVLMLSGFAGGGGRVKSGPALIPYACEDGRQVQAIYEHGGDYLHARVRLSYDGQTAELSAAPTLYGLRYVGTGEQPLAWSLRGEHASLAQVSDAANVEEAGQSIAQCVRVRGGAAMAHAGGVH
ncbi:MAG: MliC family protein [Sphingomonas sp.]|nr:MliC family protein [Sphingomonas sp.]